MSVARNVTHFMKTPSKVAGALDWRKRGGSVLSLDIRRDRIGLAVASHPSIGEEPEKLEPIRLQHEKKGTQKVLSSEVIDELQEVVRDYNVCGVLVSWPLEKEGRLGAPCGRVLHTLDSLVESSNILSNSRPFCLWPVDHVQREEEDEWGRCPSYGRKCELTKVRFSGEEQYGKEHKSIVAVDLWNDFSKKHWPELCDEEASYSQQKKQQRVGGYSSSSSFDIHGEYLRASDERETFADVALL